MTCKFFKVFQKFFLFCKIKMISLLVKKYCVKARSGIFFLLMNDVNFVYKEEINR